MMADFLHYGLPAGIAVCLFNAALWLCARQLKRREAQELKQLLQELGYDA